MFGSCAINKFLLLFLIIFFKAQFVFALGEQQAVIIEDQALVYQEADFDSSVIASLKKGTVFLISTKRYGPFYKIRLRKDKIGWIADTDVKIRGGAVSVFKETEHKKVAEEPHHKKPFFATRFRGPTIELINFTENTMGKDRSSNLLFYGLKLAGYNTLVDGEIYTDTNVLFHFGAPNYYERVTQKSADGFIFITNFLFQTVSGVKKWGLSYYGFGPMFKYSHFDLSLPNGAQTLTYPADDMSIGFVFDVGAAFKIGKSSLRSDLKYYWERSRYPGLGLNLGWEF